MKFKNVSGVIPFFIGLALIPFALLLLHQKIGIGYNPLIFLCFLTIAVFLAVVLYGWMSKQILGDTRYEAVVLFAGALLSCFVFWKLVSRASFEWKWQGAWYVFSSSSVLLSVACLYFIFGGIHYLYAKRTAHILNIYLARIHFWITYLGISFFLWNHLSNSLAHPVQLKGPGKETVFHRVEFMSHYDEVIIILVALAQLLYIYALIRPGRRQL